MTFRNIRSQDDTLQMEGVNLDSLHREIMKEAEGRLSSKWHTGTNKCLGCDYYFELEQIRNEAIGFIEGFAREALGLTDNKKIDLFVYVALPAFFRHKAQSLCKLNAEKIAFGILKAVVVQEVKESILLCPLGRA